NRRRQRAGLKRMFLHAWRLGLTHPVSSEMMELKSELPVELLPWVKFT
ncbi:MAG: RluA family pseudouridine synthase, partial [Hydrogenophaga sp.]|nr:RluA family pseudouridine synthase [Hydrogenophaga sp.]